MASPLDLKDKRFGKLLVIERVRVVGKNNAMWRCLCDCGAETIAAAANIGKSTMSCGCIAKENSKTRLTNNQINKTHGMSESKIYKAWAQMHQRCSNPKDIKYHIYGAAGVTVCERWKSFEQFYADMGDRPSSKYSLDRYPNRTGNYKPGNVRWATSSEQGNNKSNNKIYVYRGEAVTLMQAIEKSGTSIKYHTAQARILRHGCSIEEAVETRISNPRRR